MFKLQVFKNKLIKLIFRNVLKLSVIFALFFIIYQLSLFKQLSKVFVQPNLIRGTHKEDVALYVADSFGMFQCLKSKEKIRFYRVNDDYCDCLDGTDEPGTDACTNGIFHCAQQSAYKNQIPTSMVNDGICDCCDGSDEWKHIKLPFRLTDTKQHELGRYQSPCPNICNEGQHAGSL